MTCRTCGKSKSLPAFSWRRIGKVRHKKCKQCYRSYMSRHYRSNIKNYKARKKINRKRYRRENRIFVWQYRLSHPCIDCGDTDPVLLDFDHLSGKKLNVSRVINSYTMNSLKAEIAKCVVRCCRCHRKKTAKDFGWYKDLLNAPII